MGGALSNGGNVVAWLRETLRLPDDPAEVERAIAAMAPLAGGLTVLPLLAGERGPTYADDAHGAIAGLALATGPLEIFRATLEGMALRFALVEDILDGALPGIAEVLATGGGLGHSPAWRQIMADALDRPVTESLVDEASTRGAALLALEALGELDSLEQLGAPTGETLAPDPGRARRPTARRSSASGRSSTPPPEQGLPHGPMDPGPGRGLKSRRRMTSLALAHAHPPDLEAARRRDGAAFERLIGPYRAPLQAHAYRMLGSAADAEDALQETMLRAWRGLPGFQGRSSLRSWLYRIATNVCLKLIERRPKRVLPLDYNGSPSDPHDTPEGPLAESVWLEPYPDAGIEDGRASPAARYEQRESVELAFVAALQHLPARQRAVLLLRDVLGFTPAEIATALEATPAAVYSALQRAHQAVGERLPEPSQQATLRSIGDARLRARVEHYVRAWEDGDVAAIVGMLTDDATFAMPPQPGWYRGREDIGAFLAAYPLGAGRRWRLRRVRANGQPAFGFYLAAGHGQPYAEHAVVLLSLDARARVSGITAFHLPGAFARFGLPHALPA